MASQAVSDSQAGIQLNNNNRQAVSINNVSTSKAGRHAIGSSNLQADSTNSQGASSVPPMQSVPKQTVLIPRESVLDLWTPTLFPLAGRNSQAGSTASQAVSAGSQAGSAISQAENAASQAGSAGP